jgi:hypothetical protein
MGSPNNDGDKTRNSGLAGDINRHVEIWQGSSNGSLSKEGKFSASEFQEELQSEEYIAPLPLQTVN